MNDPAGLIKRKAYFSFIFDTGNLEIIMRTPLQKGEKILLVTYSSWISLISPALMMAIGLVASFYIGFIEHYGWILAAFGTLYFLIQFFSWKTYIWVVTNFRVIDEIGLLKHYAKESPLDKINNVSYDQTVLGRLFNYGHVKIQTAAQIGATDYFNVNHPKRLKDTITQAQADFTYGRTVSVITQTAAAMGFHNANSPIQHIGSELEKLAELKEQGILSEEEFNKAKNRLLNN
jgi:membrane protein YdbS with pleckstrin-like domain